MSDVFILTPVVVSALAAITDLKRREIPNVFPALLLVFACGYTVCISKCSWISHALGLLVALSLAVVVSWGDRFGGGDVKLFAALGAWFGIQGVLPLALWIALAGLPLALIAAARKQKDFAYGPAIFIGVCVHVAAPNLLQRIAG